MTPVNEIHYGCWSWVGHYYRRANADDHLPGSSTRCEQALPAAFRGGAERLAPAFVPAYGGGYVPTEEAQPEGVAQVHHAEGWTALAFWDRSIDRRGGCVSVFFLRGTFDFEDAAREARARFPTIFARYPFAIVDLEEYLAKRCSFCGRPNPLALVARRGVARLCVPCLAVAAKAAGQALVALASPEDAAAEEPRPAGISVDVLTDGAEDTRDERRVGADAAAPGSPREQAVRAR